MLTYPNIDPVIFNIYGHLSVRWYSLAYIFGYLILCWWFKKKNNEHNFMSNENCDKLNLWIIFGVIIGARFFDCIIYHTSETLKDITSVFRIWEGGMSFHGGVIGTATAVLIFSKIHKVSTMKILDYCVIIAPICLFFGRITNFINAELYGNITYTSPFRMIFPTDYTQQPRHPSQLYEAFAEGICLFFIMLFFYKKTNLIKTPGVMTGLFGIFYSIARFICEFFRSPEVSNFFNLTAGQLLSIIMFLIGILIVIISNKRFAKTKKS